MVKDNTIMEQQKTEVQTVKLKIDFMFVVKF